MPLHGSVVVSVAGIVERLGSTATHRFHLLCGFPVATGGFRFASQIGMAVVPFFLTIHHTVLTATAVRLKSGILRSATGVCGPNPLLIVRNVLFCCRCFVCTSSRRSALKSVN